MRTSAKRLTLPEIPRRASKVPNVLSSGPVSHSFEPNAAVLRKAACPCDGGCPACQAKSSDLTVSQPNDPAEIEADRIAAEVMQMPVSGGQRATPRSEIASAVVHAKSNGAGEPVGGEAGGRIDSLRGGGNRLDVNTRGFMEGRFGTDLGRVRVHTGSEAASLSRELSADAFTIGKDIYFGAGQYHPETESGKQLLAHELAHTVQQVGGDPQIQRQPASPPEHVHGDAGSTTFEESVEQTNLPNTFTKDSVSYGEVRRNELAEDKTLIHSSLVKVKYDESKCEVTLPYKIMFSDPTGSNWTPCDDEKDQAHPPTAYPTDEFRKRADAFLTSIKNHLNNWYSISVDGCEKHPCKSGGITIKTDVVEAKPDETPDFTVILANKAGRSCTVARGNGKAPIITVYDDAGDDTYYHEAGHMILGHGDEYAVDKPGQHPERERTGDFSGMANNDTYGSAALFHERHFAFVPAFLNSDPRILGGCTASLNELARPTVFDFRTSFAGAVPTAGYANIGGASGTFLNSGFDLGVPLTRNRDWEMFLGVHGTFLMQAEGEERMAFLVGARVGFEKMWSASGGGANLGGFVEGGTAFVSDHDKEKSDMTFAPGAYGYGGLNLGYKLSPGLMNMSFNAEVGVGATSQLSLHDPKTFAEDPKTLPFFTAGLRSAGMF
jgi:Domain of unknown function (DUF4157)